MKRGGGKAKGGEFERKICKMLSRWITEEERDDIFWRSAMSGGRATVQRKSGVINKTQSGDISSVDPLGHLLLDHFSVEIKFYKDLHLDSLIYGTPKSGSVIDFWKQSCNDAGKANKSPMLIMKQNVKPILLGLNMKGCKKFNLAATDNITIGIFCKGQKMVLYNFEEFLEEIDPKILEIAEK